MTIETYKNVPFVKDEYPALKHLVRASQQDITKNYMVDEMTGLLLPGTSMVESGNGLNINGFFNNPTVDGSLVNLPATDWVIIASTNTSLGSFFNYGVGGTHFANIGSITGPGTVKGETNTTAIGSFTNGPDGNFTAIVCDSVGDVTGYEKVSATNTLKTLSTGATKPGALSDVKSTLNIITGVFHGLMVLDFSVNGNPASLLDDLGWTIESLLNGTQAPTPNWRGLS